MYNPNIISSMEYEIKSRVNPYLDEKKVGFGIQEKKGESFITQENNSNVGPGIIISSGSYPIIVSINCKNFFSKE